MPERRPPASPSSPRGVPADDEAKGKTARTLPLGSVQAEVRARTATTPNPFPDREETVKRPYPHWDEAADGADTEPRESADAQHGSGAQRSPVPARANAGSAPQPSPRPGRTLLMPGASGARPAPQMPAAAPVPAPRLREDTGAHSAVGRASRPSHELRVSSAPSRPQPNEPVPPGSLQLQLDNYDLTPSGPPPKDEAPVRRSSTLRTVVMLGLVTGVTGVLTLLWLRSQEAPSTPPAATTDNAEQSPAPIPGVAATPWKVTVKQLPAPNPAPATAPPAATAIPAQAAPTAKPPAASADPNAELLQAAGEPPEAPQPEAPKPEAPKAQVPPVAAAHAAATERAAKPAVAKPAPVEVVTKPAPEPTRAEGKPQTATKPKKAKQREPVPAATPASPEIEDARNALKALQGPPADDAPPAPETDSDAPPAP